MNPQIQTLNLNFAQSQFGPEEREAVSRVLDSNWLASGKENDSFEKEFAQYVGTQYAVCVNSGSSANLLSLACLALPKNSRVLTSACGFPATLAPIVHLGLEPVLVDYDLETLNISVDQVMDAILEGNIDAVIFAHTLGNPVDMASIIFKCRENGIPVIEDCCQAVGSKIVTLSGEHSVGSYGTLGTFSFYPAHQITACGAGGMVCTNAQSLYEHMRSLRDWGKTWDWNEAMGDKKTDFTSEVDGIPYYKHYTYKTLGYNFKLPEVCAAFGRVQIGRLEKIRKNRMFKFQAMYSRLKDIELFRVVKTFVHNLPSWFGYPIVIRPDGTDYRNKLVLFLESRGIRTRPFFAGNITRHEPFKHLKGNFPVADKLMRDAFFFGVGEWMGDREFDYINLTIREWLTSQSLA